ncbi:lactococcin G-alpha/enterocin 1071A family bacteriocin [Vagococcus fluvialis]
MKKYNNISEEKLSTISGGAGFFEGVGKIVGHGLYYACKGFAAVKG